MKTYVLEITIDLLVEDGERMRRISTTTTQAKAELEELKGMADKMGDAAGAAAWRMLDKRLDVDKQAVPHA